jgi:intracellular septation protein A
MTRTARIFPWVLTLMLNIALPLLTYSVLTGRGVHEVPALLISGIWPALETVVSLARERKIDEFSLFVIIFLVLGVVAALGFNSPRLVLVKESAITGLFGIVLLASLLAPRPLMFYFGRRFATDGSAERVTWWNALWQFPGFRATQRILTVVWGVSLIAEAVLQAALTYVLPTGVMVVLSTILPYAVLGALIFWTIRFGRSRARAAADRPGATSAMAAVHAG